MSTVMIGAPAKATGGVLTAPLGTAYPTTPTEAFPATFGERGYVSQEGVTETVDSKEQKIIAWGGDAVRTISEEHSVVYKLTLLDTTPEVLAEVYGDSNVIDHGDYSEVRLRATGPEAKVWAFRILDQGRVCNIILPNAQITKRGDVKYVHSDAVGYEIEVTAYPDAEGVKAYKYITKPNAA